MRNALLIRLWHPRLRLLEAAGRMYHWATSEGRPALFGLIVVAGAIVYDQFRPIPHFWLIPTIVLAAMFVFWAWKARSSIVIEDFADHTKDKGSDDKGIGIGAATLLAIELARIRDVFRIVDERNTLPTAVGEGEPLQAAVKVDDLSEVLRRSVTPETRLTIGSLEIPIGTGMMLLARLVQGPRLRCQLHEDGNRLLMTAQLTGLRRTPAWRLERELTELTREERVHAVHEMIPELASRLFTSVGLERKVKWRAMWHFTSALRLYRSCLRTPANRAVRLLETRQRFVSALAEDEDFVLVYYNLGVVYNELCRIADEAGRSRVAKRHRNAAEKAFEKAISRAPGRWESYYALARIQFTRGRKQPARELCERVISLQRKRGSGRIERAKAHDLIGRTLSGRDAIAQHRKASKLALVALQTALVRRSSLGTEDDRVPTIRDLAANCLASLAAAEAGQQNRRRPSPHATPSEWRRWRRSARFDRITALIQLAQQLTNKDANLHFQLGAVASDWRDYETALRELNAAIRIEPERPLFLAHLARTHQRRGGTEDRASAHFYSHRAFEAVNVLEPTGEDEPTLDIVLEVWGRLGETESSKRLHEMRRFARRIPEIAKNLDEDPAACSRAERELSNHLRAQRDWQAGQLQLTVGKFHLGTAGSAPLAEDCFRSALRSLRHSPKEESRHNIRALLALALANQGKRDEALREAERAVSINPLSSSAHSALGHVCNAAGDLERARTAWSDALLWKPDDPNLHWELGFCNWRLGREAGNRAAREETLTEAGRYLRQARILFADELFTERVRIHYWLARLYEELGEFDQVIANLRIVQRATDLELVADFLVAEAYRRLGNFDRAEELLRTVITTTARAPTSDVSTEQGDGELLDPLLQDVRAKSADDDLVLGHDVLDSWPLAGLCALARCALATSHAMRHGDLAEARVQLETVELDLDRKPALTRLHNDYPERHRDLLASYHLAWGRLLLHEDDPEGAINELRISLAQQANPEAYLELALAYWSRGRKAPQAEQLSLYETARSYCTLACETDLRSLCTTRVTDLIDKLDKQIDGDAELAAETRLQPATTNATA